MDDIKKVSPEMDEILQVAAQFNQDSKSSPPSLSGTAAPTSEEDNMDFDSDDDDDSKSNHSTQNSNRKRKSKGDMQRSHHNVLERKRRDLIKDSFTKLRDAVPTLVNERVSRAQILKKAADFIQYQHQKNESVRADIEEQIKKNLELEKKISINNNINNIKQEPISNATVTVLAASIPLTSTIQVVADEQHQLG